MKRLISLFFCAGALMFGQSPAETPAPAQPSAATLDYLLQPSDLLKVQIFQEPELEREVRVSQEYTITLPLIGTVDLRGKSLRQAEEVVRTLYDRDFLVNPQINIIVMQYAARTVNVLGSVNSPGAVPFPQEQPLSLLDAIARAGGFSRLADRRRVKLTRTLPDGRSETYIVNADEVIEGNSSKAWMLNVNDVVFVPERIL
ncbi:MAG TPA: polysaccharide biosynthesis/export family protein [Opitutaceae bacterium]